MYRHNPYPFHEYENFFDEMKTFLNVRVLITYARCLTVTVTLTEKEEFCKFLHTNVHFFLYPSTEQFLVVILFLTFENLQSFFML